MIQQELFTKPISLEKKPLEISNLPKKHHPEISEWGTFKDSLKAPVHRWFTYPAGFSYKSVQHAIERFHLSREKTIYDPFMGSGTTNLTAKTVGIHSYGVEAHPFVFKIAKTKLNWEVDNKEVLAFIDKIPENFKVQLKKLTQSTDFKVEDYFPELLFKCYEKQTLIDLWLLKNMIINAKLDESVKDFFFVVVTALLRQISMAATGWPYIAPNKVKSTSKDKNVLVEFCQLARNMINDLELIKLESHDRFIHSQHTLIHGDARNTTDVIKDNSIDLMFTSPPYLNNFDYADRTRLELYFWGMAKTWREISQSVRTKLMTSATTQILSRHDPKYILSSAFLKECPKVAKLVNSAIHELSSLRKMKSGKKNYDLMVAGYFNDMHQTIKDVYRVLKPNTKALFVLGDSAPYGVHIPTDTLIGEIGLSVGFDHYEVEILRKRGDKWKANPQRHHVSLRESIIILCKN